MENEIKITKEQFDDLLKLSNIEIAADTQEDYKELVSRALIELERKLNYFNTPLSFFTAEVTNVLIVDDTELSIFQLSVMLQKIGMNVYVARNKEEAMEEALSHTNQYSPFEAPKQEVNKEVKKTNNKGAYIFIGIIFAILLLFIIFLPQISKLIGW